VNPQDELQKLVAKETPADKDGDDERRKKFQKMIAKAGLDLSTEIEDAKFMLFVFGKHGTGCASNADRKDVFPAVMAFILEHLLVSGKED
jgi:hypothetical protein